MTKSAIFGQNLRIGTGTESGYRYPLDRGKWYRYQKWVLVPIGKRQVVPVPKVRSTGTHSQKGVGTGTDQSGISTDASDSPDFCIRALISPKFVLQ